MSLVPWNPFGKDLDDIGREMASFIERMPFGFFGKGFSPRVDIYETGEDVVVKAEIPGVSKEDLNIYIDDNSIRLSGHSRRDAEFKDENTYRSERFYGNFSRTIPLPVEVKPDQAKAEYKDGILSITVPKAENSKMKYRRIDIQ